MSDKDRSADRVEAAATRAPTESVQELSPEAFRRLSRRSFATGAVAAIAGLAGARWLANCPLEDGIPWPLRRMLEWNERLANASYSPERLAPEFSADRIQPLRENGRLGLESPVTDDWAIEIQGAVDRRVPLAAILELPAHEMITEFKCVEGWSRIVRWKGVRFSDVLDKFGVATPYVGLSTPLDGENSRGEPDLYVVGWDTPSARHPQTLLAYELNGEPLTPAHGAPLRLVSSVKYGYKQIKRVATITLTSQRPPDYWALNGYDWYGGL